MMTDQLPLALAARDLVLTRHRRRALVAWLEGEVYHRGQWLGDDFAPQSSNSCRRILEECGMADLAGSWMAGVFHPARWREVGRTYTLSAKGKARKINEYAPRPGVVIPRMERPQWP